MKTGTSAFIPHDILKRPSVVSVASRMNISPAQQPALTEAMILESGGDASAVASSYATANRGRQSVTKVLAEDIKISWNAPKSSTLHWDGKQMSSLDGSSKVERLPVLVGNKENTKLLGVAQYMPGTDQRTGGIVATKTLDFVDSWGCREIRLSACASTPLQQIQGT